MEDDEKEDENEQLKQMESDPLCSRSALEEEAREMIIYQLNKQKGKLASIIDLDKVKSIQPFNESDYSSTRISLNMPQSTEVKEQQKLLQSPSEKWGKIMKSSKLFQSTKPLSQKLQTGTCKFKDKNVAFSKAKFSVPIQLKRKKGDIVNLTNVRIGFIGAGKMTEAIVKGLLNGKSIEIKRLFIFSILFSRN